MINPPKDPDEKGAFTPGRDEHAGISATPGAPDSASQGDASALPPNRRSETSGRGGMSGGSVGGSARAATDPDDQRDEVEPPDADR